MSACTCWRTVLLHSDHCCLKDAITTDDGGLLLTCGHENEAVALMEDVA